jgi:uncharacterized membrane protein (DUF4010 family)
MQALLPSPDLVIRCLLGFAVGALIGVERQKRLTEETSAGMRSFGLHSLLGMLSAYTSVVVSNIWIFLYAVFISSVIISVHLGYKLFRTMRKGTTTSIVLALSFVLGALVGFDVIPPGDLIGPLEVLAMTVAFLVFLILGFKEEFAAAVEIITKDEMLSAVELGVIILFLWPLLLPYQTVPIGPIEFPLFNTYVLIVVLLSISFVNYVLVKKFKHRGVYFFGFFGGFANSEATVSSLTDFHVKTERSNPRRISISALFANIAMVLRNAVIVVILDPSLRIFSFYLIPLVILVLLGVFRIVLEFKNHKGIDEEEIDAKLVSPFEFGAAFRFAVVFSIVSLISLFLQEAFSDLGILIAAVVGGIANAGAVVFIVTSAFVTGSISLSTTVFAVILAIIMAVMNKMIYVYAADRDRELFRLVVRDSLVMAAGAVVYLVLLGIGLIIL